MKKMEKEKSAQPMCLNSSNEIKFVKSCLKQIEINFEIEKM